MLGEENEEQSGRCRVRAAGRGGRGDGRARVYRARSASRGGHLWSIVAAYGIGKMIPRAFLITIFSYHHQFMYFVFF